MTTYTTSAKVARVLRSSADGKVRLSSDAVDEIITFISDNDRTPISGISIDYGQISVSSSFQGTERLKFNFTSATDFDVYEIETTLRQELLIGSGDISSQVVVGDFTIPAGTFGGSITSGNIVEIAFSVQISDDDVDAYIEDSEIEIDSMLSEDFVGRLTGGATRLFTQSNVPQTIALATQYLTAYYVYTDVYRAKFQEGEDFNRNYSNRWKKRAESLIRRYAKTARRSLPRVISFPTFVDKFGIDSTGPDPASIGSNIIDIGRDADSDKIFEPQGITEEPQ